MKPRLKNEFQAKLNHIDGSRLPEGTIDTGFVEKLAIRGEVVDPLIQEKDILALAFRSRPKQVRNDNIVGIYYKLKSQHEIKE